MKVLLFCYEYPPIGGGGGVAAQQYAEAWTAGGHEVRVITSRAPGLSARERVNGVDVVRVHTAGRKDRATTPFVSMLSYNVMGLIHVLSHRKALMAFDVMNTHFSIPTGPMASLAAWLLRLPNVLTIIGGDIYDPSKKSSPHRFAMLRLVNRWVINSADRVIAISSDTKRRAEHYYRISRPVEIINYGFSSLGTNGSGKADLQLDSEKFYLIAVGRLIRRKGFDVLVRAMKHLPDDIELLLVGDGPLDEPLRTLAADQAVAHRVHMLGFQTRENIHQLLRKSDCFVLSSLHEGLGIVIQEAMDAGLPVVATDNGGQVDLIKHQRNGLLVETGDEEALAGAIRSLYWDRDLAESMAQNNLSDIQQLYMTHNNRLYLKVFEEVAHIAEREPAKDKNETQPVRAGS